MFGANWACFLGQNMGQTRKDVRLISKHKVKRRCPVFVRDITIDELK